MTDKQIQEFLTNRIVDKLVAFIMEDEGLDMDKALEKVYCSLMNFLQRYIFIEIFVYGYC